MHKTAPYEKPELRELTGPTLRPGGLGLTRRGLGLCAFTPGDKVLDLCCGPGASLALMRSLGLKALGLDKSPLLLREAAQHGPVMQGDAADIPLQSAALDGIIMECALSLMPDKNAVLKEVRRVLKNGGRLLLSDLFIREENTWAERICGTPGLKNDSPLIADQIKNACYTATEKSATSCIAGAETLPALRGMLKQSGFNVLHCLDETRSLKELAVNMIFRHGSTAKFFEHWGLEPCGCQNTARNLGYIMFVAEAAIL